jgi:hypothetical protein
VLVAMLVDDGPASEWATGVLHVAAGVLAQHLALFEAANTAPLFTIIAPESQPAPHGPERP